MKKLIMINIDKIIKEISDQHPYKEKGNRDSYSQYNEGWSDACEVLGERIKKELTLGILYKNNVQECNVKEESEQICKCDAALIRTSTDGGEYCGICEKDIN